MTAAREPVPRGGHGGGWPGAVGRDAAGRAWTWLLAPVAVGTFLRLFRIGPQLLLADELHAPRTLLELDLAEILTTYLPSDNSVPLTAFFELLVGRGVELSELHLRLPSIVAGLLALVVIPLAVGRRLGPATGCWTAWLVAISPGLVFYSRIARSYMPVVLLAFVAVMAFERWWRTGRAGSAAAYVGCAAAAAWFHLGAAPLVAAPLLWAGGAKLMRRRDGPSPVAVLVVGLGLAAACAAFLLPAWDSFVALLGDKSGARRPSGAELGQVLALQAGAAHPAAALLFWALALLGVVRLFTRRPAFAGLVALPPVVNLATLLVLAPFGVESAMILNRYLLVGLPFVLIGVAVGLEGAAESAEGWRRGQALAGRRIGRDGGGRAGVALVVPLLVLAGPFLDRRMLWSSFLAHDDFVTFSRPKPTLVDPGLVPAFYRRLAADRDDGAVIEVPSLPTWTWQTHLRIYQDLHRRRVLLAPLERGVFGPQFALRNFVRPDAETFLAAPARWLVLHRKSAWELGRVDLGDTVGLPVSDEMRSFSRGTARRLGGHLRRRWGPPDVADDVLLVWDLERLRRSVARPEEGAAAQPGAMQ